MRGVRPPPCRSTASKRSSSPVRPIRRACRPRNALNLDICEGGIMDLASTAQVLGNFGDFIGAAAVVATLVYLSVQLKQTAGSIRSSVATMGTGFTTQVWQLPIDKPELADMLQRGNQTIANLSDNEFLRYLFFYGTVFRSFEQYFILHELGAISDEQWAGQRLVLSQILVEKGVKQTWLRLRGQHVPGFVEFADQLAQVPEDPSNRGLIHRPPTDGRQNAS